MGQSGAELVVRDVGDGVAVGGGCFFNRILSAAIEQRLRAAGLRVWRPDSLSVGDASLALGQAWVAAAQRVADAGVSPGRPHAADVTTCAATP